jgi:hypothetical protein
MNAFSPQSISAMNQTCVLSWMLVILLGGGMGKGGTVTLSANDNKVAEGRLGKTIPVTFSICEGLDIGMDVGSPVDFTYKPPFPFTGKIEKVTIDLE